MVFIVSLCQEVSNMVFQRVPGLANAVGLPFAAGASVGQSVGCWRGARSSMPDPLWALSLTWVLSGQRHLFIHIHQYPPNPEWPFWNQKPPLFSLQRQVVEVVPSPLLPPLGFYVHPRKKKKKEKAYTSQLRAMAFSTLLAGDSCTEAAECWAYMHWIQAMGLQILTPPPYCFSALLSGNHLISPKFTFSSKKWQWACLLEW